MKTKKYTAIIFDLDGTLTESAEGIINSIRHALKYFNIEETDQKKLSQFIGPPLNESFQLYYQFSAEEAKLAVKYYREYFATKGIFENYLYPGILAMLKRLEMKPCTLFIGTSKPTIYAKQILAHFNIDHFFKDIIGSNMDLTRVSKQEIISYILKKFDLVNSKSAPVLMIGDTKFDIEGATKCNIDSVAVLYGHGSQKSIESVNPTYLLNIVDELTEFLDLHT